MIRRRYPTPFYPHVETLRQDIMDTVDIAIDLATAVVKSGFGIWAGPFSNIPGAIVDLINAKVVGKLQQRRTERFFDNCVDTVAEKLMELIDQRGKDIDKTDLNAAIHAVRDTFDSADMTVKSLIKADLDARALESSMKDARSAVLRAAPLNESGEQFYDLLLRESCTYALEFVSTLPNYDVSAFAEILKRETLILESLREVLSRLPVRQSIDDFGADYRRLVILKLDRLQIFGAKLQSDYGRRYPLSVAYTSLGAASPRAREIGATSPSGISTYLEEWASTFRSIGTNHYRLLLALDAKRSWTRPDRQLAMPRSAGSLPRLHDAIFVNDATPIHGSVAGEIPIEQWLASERRVLLIGEAGSGKSTLLQWLAVRAARADFTAELRGWNGFMPFYVPLRRYAADGLPAPENFPASVGKHIIDSMPQGWVHSYLRNGTALILIDGLDELKEGTPRAEALEWLQDLIITFPRCVYVLTSRPGAVEGGLSPLFGFTPLELRPMPPAKIRSFVEHWHEAMRIELTGTEEHELLSADQAALMSTLETDRHVRTLCVNPLLCALICALNRERHGHLPKDRMGVYRGALEMLLDMRDRDRGIVSSLDISQEAKVTLLQDLALYLVRNAWSDATVDRAREQIARSSRTLDEITAEPDKVLQFLLERSGLIRTPSEGRIDFVHRSFQEYLAGKAAVDDDETGYLLKHAADDQFRDIIVMAVGHAQPRQSEELLRGLISLSASDAERDPNRLRLLAIACLQTVRRIEPDLRKKIEDMAQELLPPESFDVAQTLAATGPIVLDLMAERPASSPSQAAASVRVASLLGGRDAMTFIADVASQFDGIEDEVIRAWPQFDLDEYAATVISNIRWSGRLTITDRSLLTHAMKIPGLKELTVPSNVLEQANFPAKPRDVRFLRVTNDALKGLSTLEGWEEITHLEISLDSLNEKLHALRKFKLLEALRIISPAAGMIDLAPMGRHGRLGMIQMVVPRTSSIRVSGLADAKGLEIYVPPDVAVIGRSALKNSSRVIVRDDFPDLIGYNWTNQYL